LKIAHIAAIRLSKESGMGRIAWNWQQAFEACGHQFIHIGIEECPRKIHPLLWGKQAYQYFEATIKEADVILAHEPAAGYFTHLNVPVLLVSHGIEQRGWGISQHFGFEKRTLKSFFIPKLLRFWSNTEGINRANKLLLSNQEDKDYAVEKHNRLPSDVLIFKNGYYENAVILTTPNTKITTFLFNASWLERKGIGVLVGAFIEVKKQFRNNWHLILAGVGNHETAILAAFTSNLKENITVLPYFSQSEEAALYQKADVFILPSYFEGQSLALTQAMASGLCCICSDNCGQRDFIQHQHNGLLFKTGNAQDLAQQIKHVLEQRNKIKIYGNAAYETVKDLTWQKVSEDVVTLCENLVSTAQKQKKMVKY
jgi:glycosyltransferase involved in cell wall biosynthesis